MKQPEGFLKAMRSPILFDLFLNEPNAFRLLFFIAYTLNRDGSKNLYGCQLGESRVSFNACKLTDSEYRTAKKYLQGMGLAEFITRGKGKGRKTYATLTSSNLFDPNIIEINPSIEIQKQRNENSIETLKKEHAKYCYSSTYENLVNNQHPDNDAIIPHNEQEKEHKNINEQEKKKIKEKRRKKSQASEDGLRLANQLYQSILLIHPDTKKPTRMNEWALDIDRIIQIDGKSIEKIEEVINYLPHDAFWCKNVLSGLKLRCDGQDII